jgi:hypothetical protein
VQSPCAHCAAGALPHRDLAPLTPASGASGAPRGHIGPPSLCSYLCVAISRLQGCIYIDRFFTIANCYSVHFEHSKYVNFSV